MIIIGLLLRQSVGDGRRCLPELKSGWAPLTNPLVTLDACSRNQRTVNGATRAVRWPELLRHRQGRGGTPPRPHNQVQLQNKHSAARRRCCHCERPLLLLLRGKSDQLVSGYARTPNPTECRFVPPTPHVESASIFADSTLPWEDKLWWLEISPASPESPLSNPCF